MDLVKVICWFSERILVLSELVSSGVSLYRMANLQFQSGQLVIIPLDFFHSYISVLNDAIDCVETAVEEECGREAAEHQITIEKRYLQSYATEIECQFGKQFHF